MFRWFKNRRRQRLLTTDVPASWLKVLESNVYPFASLNPNERSKLLDCVRIMVAEQTFEGCDGLVVTDEIRVTIAGQASLLLLGSEEYYFDTVASILVFPNAVRRVARNQGPGLDGATLVHGGEAYQSGQIVLSWADVHYGGKQADGHNVVIHEFAHHLDSLDGEMGGHIVFEHPSDGQRWNMVVAREYQDLVDAKETGRPTLLNQYGAKNQAEFFAVATEAFFERSAELEHEHAELYGLLQKFYKVNPIPWH